MTPREIAMTIRSIGRGCALLALALLAGSNPAQAQSQLTIVVSVAAGGSSDLGMRTISARVEQMGGPKIVIENRPGGGGVTATLGVRDAAPDGRTLMLASYATHVINPAMAGGTQYNPIADFQPITTLFSFPVTLSVPAAFEAKSVPELVAIAKRKQGGLAYASQGVGTAGHLLGELFRKSSDAPLIHVPYKGAAPAVIDLVAGRVDMMFVGILPSQQHLAAGTLRALAVTSRTRMPELPQAPTMAEAGHPDVNTDFVWFGLMGPAKIPDATVRNLHDLFSKAVMSPEVRDKLAAQGIAVEASTPEQFAARIKADTAKFGPIIKASGAAK
jgi:tripartite-type tricarboxylate transporter receptor subunit TctC